MRPWLALIPILLVAAFLRFQGITDMSTVVVYDEAAYALDAQNLLENPRLTPFFENNYGRESLWMYLLAPMLTGLGMEPVTLRIAGAFMGVLTIAASYRLTREVFRWRWAGFWAATGLAVLYWHVHLSHIGFRAILYPLVGAIAFTALLRAYRLNRGWIFSGVLFGVLFYTYIGARVWLGIGIGLMLIWALLDQSRRRGALRAFLSTGIVCAPLAIYLITQGDTASARVQDVAIRSSSEFLSNLQGWLNGLFFSGDPYFVHNSPLRPVFDLPLALLFIVGSIALGWTARKGWIALLVYAMAGGALIPALLSSGAPHFLRGIGLVIPLALIMGAGAVWIIQHAPRMGTVIVPGLLIWAGIHTAQDFNAFAPTFSDYLPEEQALFNGINALSAFDTNEAIYFMPLRYDYPLIAFQRDEIGERDWGAFDPGYCLVYIQADSALYLSLPPLSEFHRDQLMRYGQVKTVSTTDTVLYRVEPDARLWNITDEAIFGGIAGIRLINDLPELVRPGETLQVDLAVRALEPLAFPLGAFIHLYGDPTPYDGGRLWSNDTRMLCEPFPADQWRADEVIIQSYEVIIPEDTPSGMYQIALGMMNADTDERLHYDAPYQVAILGEIFVGP